MIFLILPFFAASIFTGSIYTTTCDPDTPRGTNVNKYPNFIPSTVYIGQTNLLNGAYNYFISNGNGTDNFGFAAFPGGERRVKGPFFIQGSNGFWWSSSEYNNSNAWYRSLFYDTETIYRDKHPKNFGFSVRCLREIN